MRRSGTLALAAAIVVSLAVVAPADATTRTVSKTADGGAGSLRQTIADSGNGDKVVVPAGTYTLSGTSIPISKSIEIEGAGSDQTKVVGPGGDRIFNVTGAGTVRFTNLALEVRWTSTGGVISGAGILADNASPLVLTGVGISGTADASGASGGGGGVVYGAAIYAQGDLTLVNTRVEGMHVLAPGGTGAGGGGGVIYATVYASAGFSMSGSSIDATVNDAHGTGSGNGGGVIYGGALYASGGGTAQITNSTFDDNSANVNGGVGASAGGGVVYGTLYTSASTLTLSHVSASHESATALGGTGGGDGGVIYGLGMYQTGSIDADHLSATGNSMKASGTGPGDADGGTAYGGGVYLSVGSSQHASIQDATLDGNSTDVHGEGTGDGGTSYGTGSYISGSGLAALTRVGASGSVEDATARGTGNGGTVYAAGLYSNATLTLTNATVANNTADASATGGGTGGTAYAGGLYMAGGGTLFNTTIAGNRALTSTGGTSFAGNVYPSGTVHATNTIVSGGQAQTKPNCNTALTSDGHNIDSLDECGFHGTGDQFGTDPRLGPLGDHGGMSLTRPLLPPSTAIDHGDPSVCGPTDQRGFSRQGPCDIGSYEYTPADLSLTATGPRKVGIGATIDYPVTLRNGGPASSFGTVLRDALPAGLAAAGGSFPPGPCTVAQAIACPLGTVANGQSLQGHVLATAKQLGTVTNTIGFTSFSDDPNPANDTASVATKVVHVAASKLKVPGTIRSGSRLPLLQPAKKKKKKKPQFITFKLNGPAKVTLTFQRKKGRKFKKAGKLTVSGHTGKNKLRFAGRLSKKKRLKPGRYRLVLVAVDSTRHKSKPLKKKFKLKR